MSKANEAGVAAAPEHALDLRRLLLVGAVLPMAVAAVTYLLLYQFIVGDRTVTERTIGFGCFVLEIGLVGVIVGTLMPHPWLKWLLFGWVMVLIDLLVASSALVPLDRYVSELLPAGALVAAQIGLAIVLGTLGTARWYWRAPLSLALGAGLLAFWLLGVTGWSGQLMSGILVVQAIMLTLMSIGLRVRGYRLVHLDSLDSAATPGNRRFQFGIKDVLVWTTSLAILLGLMRGAGMLVWVSLLDQPSLYFKGTVALLSANVIVVALWASLGQGHWAVRYSVLVVMLIVLGTGLGALSTYGEDLLSLWRTQAGPVSRRYYDYDFYQWREVGWWWIAWMFLSGGLLTASLMIFRTVGYRLVRGTGPVKAAA